MIESDKMNETKCSKRKAGELECDNKWKGKLNQVKPNEWKSIIISYHPKYSSIAAVQNETK